MRIGASVTRPAGAAEWGARVAILGHAGPPEQPAGTSNPVMERLMSLPLSQLTPLLGGKHGCF